MATTTPNNASDLFRQAVETFQAAIRTGVKMQEESAKRFSEMVRDFTSPAEWQKSTQNVMNEAIRTTQKNIEESIRMMNHNAQTAMGLWQKAFENRPPQSAQEGQARSDELWETALGALRTNTQVILQANARILESWAKMAMDLTERMREQVEQQTSRMSEEVKQQTERFQQNVQQQMDNLRQQAEHAAKQG